MPAPLFSIVSVTYDNIAGLRQTAQSVESQSCRDFEWLVIDGGSRDGTVAFLENFNFCTPPLSLNPSPPVGERERCQATGRRDAFPSFFFLSEPDSGIYDAMNKGIVRARGRYTIFMNAGDRFATPQVLAGLESALRAHPQAPDFLYGDALEDDRGAATLKPARSHETRARGMFTHHQAMLYRTEILKTLRYDPHYDIAADYDLTCRFLDRASHALYLPQPLCFFEAGGVSQRRAARGRAQQYRIRRTLKLCSPIENAAVYLMQSSALFLRRLAPGLYWRLRRGASGRPVLVPPSRFSESSSAGR